MARGGPASRSLVSGITAACPFGPPALLKLPLASAPAVGRWTSPREESLHLLFTSLFGFSRPNRAGASNPGDGSRSSWSMRQRPGHRTIYCRRATRLRGEDAVPCGLASATTPRSLFCEAAASLLLAWTFKGWWWRQAPVRVLRNVRDLPPPP
jgi:hypothetical protein